MTKIAHVSPKGTHTMTVYYDGKARQNPYRVYVEGYVWDWIDVEQGSGRWKPFKTLHNRYADLGSAMRELCYHAQLHNEEGR